MTQTMLPTKLPEVSAIDAELADDGWLTVWFNRPETRNALSEAVTHDLWAVLSAVQDDRSVRGITLRGRGGIFCAGGDLKAFKAMGDGGVSADAVMTMSTRAGGLFAMVNAMPQCTIAMVEGAAMAGGFGLACCCDIVLAEERAVFATSETMIGLSPAQIAPYVVQRLGPAVARRLMLTSARLSGAEAHRLGLVDFLEADGAALAATEGRVRAEVLGCAPGAVADTKALLLALPPLTVEERIEAAAENFTRRMLSEEAREGIGAFLEKRPPRWRVGLSGPSSQKEPRRNG